MTDEKPRKPRLRFTRNMRILRQQDFRRVLSRGHRVSCAELQLVGARAEGAATRLGLAVSRRVGRAVARNRLKRRLREIFRIHYRELPEGVDLVVIARPGAAELELAELRSRFLELVGDWVTRGERRRARRRPS